MPYKTFVASTTLPASDLNTYLMNQANIVCTSTTRPASPNEGMEVYETDTDKLQIYTTATTGWKPPWNLPWGFMGKGTATSDTGPITVTTDLSGLSVTFTAQANRQYKATLHSNWDSSVTGDVAAAFVVYGSSSTVCGYGQRVISTAGAQETLAVMGLFTSASGSITVKAQGGRAAGSGTLACKAASTNPAWLVVEDIGPTGVAP